MGLTKEQVKGHIAGIEARVTHEIEQKQYGYEFAKLYHQVKDYDNAIKYLTGYLSVNGRDHRAQKFMGRLYVAVGDHLKAIAHFKRSLDLKKGQRDVIEAVASVYCKLDNPTADSLKDCLVQIKAICQTHPLIIPLSEKIQAIEGGSSMVDTIKAALAVNPGDVSLHIQLVRLHSGSGELYEAFIHCNSVRRSGKFKDCLEWQQCALGTAESYYEELRSKGGMDSGVVLMTLVSVLESISDLFNTLTQPQNNSQLDSAALLLKFDKVLCACGHTLRSVPSSAHSPLYHIALKEMCGRLYYMAGCYLYLSAQRLQQSVVGSSEADSILQLGVMCLLCSLRAPPPALEHVWTHSEDTLQLLRVWHSAACARTSIAGHHLKIVTLNKGKYFFEFLPKIISERGGKLYLIKTLFGEKTEKLQVKFGSRNIQFLLQESFLGEDDAFLRQPPDLPDSQALEYYDKACAAAERELCNVVWRCLAYRALEADQPVLNWLLGLFDGLRLDTPILTSTEPDTLCVYDLEVFLVLLADLYSQRLTSSTHQLYSAPSSPVTPAKLSSALSTCLPSSLVLLSQHTHYWTTVLHFLHEKLSVQDAVGVKKVVREFLSYVRGLSPLQLSLNQLSLLARHFRDRAEKSVKDGSSRDTTVPLLKWSSHYWNVIVCVITEGGTPSSESHLLAEARMALANAALYRQDTTKALSLYSRVKTAHSAWNQSQIYLHLADVATEPDTEDKLSAKLDCLKKAADTLDLAIARLSPSDEGSLRKKLVSQRDEVENLLGDVKKSPLACALNYDDDSPLLPRRSSTPFRHNSSNTSVTKEEMSSTPHHVTSHDGSLSMSRDQQSIAALAIQLQKVQAELDELKSRSLLSPAQPPRPSMSPRSQTMYSPRQTHLSPMGSSPLQQSPAQSLQPVAGLSHGLQPFHSQASPGSHTSPLAARGQSQYPFQLSPPGPVFAPQLSFGGSPQTGRFPSPGLSLPPHLQSHSFVPQGSSDLNSRPSATPLFGTTQSAPPQLPVTTPADGGPSMPLSTCREQVVKKPFTVSPHLGLQTATPTFSPPTVVHTHPASSRFQGVGQNSASPSASTDSSTVVAMPAVTTTCVLKFGKTKPFEPQSFPRAPFSFSSSTSFQFGQSEPSSTQSSGLASGFSFTFAGTQVNQEPKLTLGGISLQPPAAAKSTKPTYPGSTLFTAVSSGNQQSSQTLSVGSTSSSNSSTSTQLFTKASESPKATANVNEGFPILSSLLSGSQPTGPTVTKETVDTNLSTIGSAIFSTPAGQDKHSEDQDVSLDTSDRGPDFTPIVSLPEVENLQTGEENEEIMFVHRAKLYRFDKEWKEKGIGEMKILKHRTSGKVRLLMRRDQIFKLCCNHYIASGMTLQYVKGSSRMLCWFTSADFSDGEAKPEKLAIKFKTEEVAAKFKETVESMLTDQRDSENSSDESSAPTNESSVDHSNQSSINDDSSLQSSSAVSSVPEEKHLSSDFQSRFAPPADSWSCDVCLVNNDKSAMQCVACSAKKPGSTVKEPTASSSLQSRFAPPADSWSCDVCLVNNDKSAMQCVACSAKKPGSTVKEPTASSNLQSRFAPPADSWSCDVCLVNNDKSTMQCVACSAKKPGSTVKEPTASSSLQSRFAPPADSWSCDVCMVNNDKSAMQCVACSAKKPGSTSIGSTFSAACGFKLNTVPPLNTAPHGGGVKFGLTSLLASSTSTSTASTGGFKLPLPSYQTSSTSSNSLLSASSADLTGGFNLGSFSFLTTTTSISTPPEGGFKFSLPSLQLSTNTSPATSTTALASPNLGLLATTASVNTPSEGFKFSHPSFQPSTNSMNTTPSGGFTVNLTTSSLATAVTGTSASTSSSKFDQTSLSTTTATTSTSSSGSLKQGFEPPLSVSSSTASPGEGFDLLSATSFTTISTGDSLPQFSGSGFDIPGDQAVSKEDIPGDQAVSKEDIPDDQAVSKEDIPGDQAVSKEDIPDDQAVSKEDIPGDQAVSKEDIPGDQAVSKEDIPGDQAVSKEDFIDDEVNSKETPISDDEIILISEEMPSPEKIELAQHFQLPKTFFNYEKKQPCPGCRGCMGKADNLPSASKNESDTSEDHSTPTLSLDTPHESTTIRFSAKGDITSFSELASSKGSFWFDSKSQSKSPGFSRAGELVFGSKVPGDDNGDPEAEAEVHFKPLVSLPDVQLKTGEESEEALFSYRAKLFRFDPTVKQWKERGVGDIKITRNVNTNKFRVIMRRDQIRKLCCNHFITPAMDLTPNQGSDRSWVWYTPCDFSDGEPKPEKLAVRFKHPDTATEFKKVFDKCITSSSEISKDTVLEHEEVDSCGQSSNQVSESNTFQRLAPPTGSWTCHACYVSNLPGTKECASCKSSKEDTPPPTNVSDQETVVLHSPDSSTHRNPLLQFPLNMSPVTTLPYICPKPLPALEKEHVQVPVTTVQAGSREVTHISGSKTSADIPEPPPTLDSASPVASQTIEVDSEEVISESKTCTEIKQELLSSLEKEQQIVSLSPGTFQTTQADSEEVISESKTCTEIKQELLSSLEKEQQIVSLSPGTFQTMQADSEEVISESKTCTEIKQELLSSLEKEQQFVSLSPGTFQTTQADSEEVISKSNNHADIEAHTQDDDVIFLYEELPNQDLIEKAKKFMLPPSFYLYETKAPCHGCRGCKLDSEESDLCPESDSVAAIRPTNKEDVELKDVNVQDSPSLAPVTSAFGFSSQSTLLSFSDLTSSNEGGFAKATPGFQFHNAGKQLFSVASADDNGDPEAEADISFRPIVTLSEATPIKSWDDDADTLFVSRGKLYRFGDGQWKERGVGDIKIMRHRKTNQNRIIMRRDQILKVCCNHYITAGMTLVPGSNDKSWVWFTQSDFTDEHPQPEKLAARFKDNETAAQFKKVFEACVSESEPREAKEA